MSAILSKSEIDQLMRMAFLNEESLKMIAEDGEIRGAIGKTYEFRAFKVKGFDTLYQIDISEMGDGNPVIESLVLQKYPDSIPRGMPGGSRKVYSIPVRPKSRDGRPSLGRAIRPVMEDMVFEIQM